MLRDKKEKILQNTKNTKDLRVTFFIYCDCFSLKSLFLISGSPYYLITW